MSVISEVLDCEGPEFDGLWGDLFAAAADLAAGMLAAPRGLLDLAAQASERWKPVAAARGRRQLAEALMGRLPARALSGFCAHGLLTAHLWRCLDVTPQTRGVEVANCLRPLVTGPVDTTQWGPLEFSESTRWPVKVLDVRLLHEHWARCGEQPVSACPSVTAREMRRGLGLIDDGPWAGGGTAAARAAMDAVAAQVETPAQRPVPLRLHQRSASAEVAAAPLQLLVIGSHLGSNMEPLSLVLACLHQASLTVEATVYGTWYPFPGLICELFRHCARNRGVEEAVELLAAQMYSPRWEPADVLATLQEGLYSDSAFRAAELLLCTQPMAICALLRALTELPMLLYQAFPLVGATPPVHRQLLLLAFREMARSPRRSAFVAYSEFLASQFEYQVGQRPTCIRPHSLYATQGRRYNPDRENPRILVSRVAGWARDGGMALLHLAEAFAERGLRPGTRFRLVFLGANWADSDTVAGVARPFSYEELPRFRAAVFFPWDMGMLLFSELYNVGVPLLVPSRAWMAAIIKRTLEYTDFGWWQVRHDSAAALPGHGAGAGGGAWPWLEPNSTVAQVLAMYDRTDFVRWPFVASFGSLAELMARIASLDFDEASEGMRQWNDAALGHSLGILSRVLDALLGGGEPLHPGESSCV